MKRNMMKTVEKVKGNIPTMYDMDSSEMDELYRILKEGSSDAIFNALSIAFDYGFMLGARAQKSGKFHAN